MREVALQGVFWNLIGTGGRWSQSSTGKGGVGQGC